MSKPKEIQIVERLPVRNLKKGREKGRPPGRITDRFCPFLWLPLARLLWGGMRDLSSPCQWKNSESQRPTDQISRGDSEMSTHLIEDTDFVHFRSCHKRFRGIKSADLSKKVNSLEEICHERHQRNRNIKRWKRDPSCLTQWSEKFILIDWRSI